MKKIVTLLLTTTLFLSLTACGAKNSENTDSQNGTSDDVSTAETRTPVDDALDQYSIVLSQAALYQYDPYGDVPSTGNYRYALVQMQTGDTVPTLLLEQESTDYMYYMRVFQYDPNTQTVIQPVESLMEGMAQRGGYRGSIGMMEDGNGIQSAEASSGSGDLYISRSTLNGNTLSTVLQWSGKIGDTQPAGLGFIEIEWHDISDLSAFGAWSSNPNIAVYATTDTGSVNTEAANSDIINSGASLPTDGNRIVLTGTINSYTYDGVLALQGISDPNPGSSPSKNRNFRLIVLDIPQDMTLSSVDGFLSHMASIIDVSYANGLEGYDGQHVIFSIDPNTTSWPSDTSLPLGEPGTSDIHILG
ncbi:MAG: hypothetical protein J1F01_10095 [Oscillospiraceae bacterium]|nr:hypothetical protein [Oscillospiraceae bacterium]